MVIKESIYTKCKECGDRRLVSDEEYGCDVCKKKIMIYEDSRSYLNVTVFYNDDRQTTHLHFCSWKCCLKLLKNIQRTKNRCDHFITLPYLTFDEPEKINGLGYEDFIKAIKDFK